MVIESGRAIMRWRVLAKLPKTGRDAARAELRVRANRSCPELHRCWHHNWRIRPMSTDTRAL
jgi:hypothetical protein